MKTTDPGPDLRGSGTPPGILGAFAVWLYAFDQLQNDELLKDLHQRHVTVVFLSVRDAWLSQLASKLAEFVRAAQQRGIEVHAMTLEDATFTFREHHDRARQLVQNIIEFCRQNSASCFDGVHIDTEPHALPQWGSATWQSREGWMQQYVQLISGVSAQIRNSGLQTSAGERVRSSAAIAWWYNEQAKAGNLPSGSASLLGTHLDFLVPMAYIGSNASDIIARIDDEIRAAATMVGISTEFFSRYQDMIDTIALIDKRYLLQQPHRNYRRVCVFDYAALVKLS